MNTRNEPHRQLKAQSRSNYLIAYNAISCVLWAVVLGRLLLLLVLVGPSNVYGGVGTWTKWTQMVALLEMLHSAIGLVRAPLFTTGMQVLSRLFLIWPVLTLHPDATQDSVFYSTMLLAWSITEVIRYSYFVVNLQTAGSSREMPEWLQWLRYNTFYPLYPLGIGSECMLVLKASLDERTDTLWKWGFWGALVLYVPGSYILYTHMITQRRRVMRGKAREN